MKSILIVEDEPSIRGFVVINMKRAGYDVIEAESGEEALELLTKKPGIRLALLDLMLPGMDGFELCRQIRAAKHDIGIIMLTARTQEVDKVTGLMTGADDYITKPFSPTELIARVDALFRRIGGGERETSSDMRRGPFVLNNRNRTITKNEKLIRVTQVEYSIMKLFMGNPGKAMSREEILSSVWGRNYAGDLKIVDVNIRRLRMKIEDDATKPKYIGTVWGYGYKWDD
ncbi:MAG: response regulator transcription factor [Oscillospiraceae bacterium]|nr:response regulator transcription factor [Oscillospiraceae bacterium]